MRPRILLRVLGISALLAATFAPVPAPASADPAGDLYKTAQDAYDKLLGLPEAKRKFRHHWKDAIARFDAVAEQYPKSYRADDALYMVGKLYTELYDISVLGSDADEAITAFGRCASRFPSSNYADDCLVLRAKLQIRRGKHKDAIASLRQVVTDHPKGDQVKEAESLLAREGIKVTVASSTPVPTATPAVVPPAGKKKTSGGEASAESQAVSGVKHWSNPSYTQVAIYGGGPMSWTVNELKADKDKDRRIYVDLKKAHVGAALKDIEELTIADGLLQRARVAQNDPETVRVVLDVASMDDYTVIPMEDPFRVLVQVFGKRNESVAVPPGTAAPGPTPGLIISMPTPSATPDPKEKARELQEATQKNGIPLFQQLGLKVGKIYVDAGHGGHDPGARGPTGLLEKDVTLKIAKKVAAHLTEAGYEAVLTRTDDTYLSLEERSGIANEGKGDLFVSIHCNSTENNKQISGVETYFANTASDKAAERLAAIENATTTQKMSELEHILEGLLRGAFTPMSADLAGSVQQRLYAAVKKVSRETKDLKVKSALFYVLLTAQMPAILVETSFISNKADEKRLKDDKHLERIATSISDGIDEYLQSRFRMPVVADEKQAEPPKKAEAGDEKGRSGGESATKSKGKSIR